MAITVEQFMQEALDWYNLADDITEDSKVEDFDEIWPEFYESLTSKESSEKYGYSTATIASGPVYIEEDHGGGEGDGEIRYVVFSVGDQFFKVSGYYASWDGSNWDDPTPVEVVPTEKTITVFERKK